MKHHDSTASKMQSASHEPPGMADLSRHVPDELRDRFVAAYKGRYGYWFEFDGSVRFRPHCFPAADTIAFRRRICCRARVFGQQEVAPLPRIYIAESQPDLPAPYGSMRPRIGAIPFGAGFIMPKWK